jgi:hypothetical protein
MKITKIVLGLVGVLFAGQILHAVADVQKVMSGPCVMSGGNPRNMVLAGQEYRDVKWCGFRYIDSSASPFVLNSDEKTSTFYSRPSRKEIPVTPGAFILIIVENYAYLISWKGYVEVLDLSQGQAKSIGVFPAPIPYQEPPAYYDDFQRRMAGFSYEVVNNKILLRHSSINPSVLTIDITDPRHPVVKE